MSVQVRRWLPDQVLVVGADSSAAARAVLAAAAQVSKPATLITCLRLDAAVDVPAPPRQHGMRGAPRKTGVRLPTLAAIRDDSETAWALMHVRWSGGAQRQVRVTAATAVW